MRTDKMPLPAADVLIVDEAHHVAAVTWRAFLKTIRTRNCWPDRHALPSDGRGLGNYFDRIIEGPQIPDLIAQGIWCPSPSTTRRPSPDLRGVETRQGDYVIKQLADRMNREDLVGDIVCNWYGTANADQTLVFCVDVAHSVHVKNEFIDIRRRAEHLDGTTPKRTASILARLASDETEVVCQLPSLDRRLRPASDRLHRPRPTDQTTRPVPTDGRSRTAPGTGQEQSDPDRPQRRCVSPRAARRSRSSGRLRYRKRAENPTHEARSRQDNFAVDRVHAMCRASDGWRAVSALRLPAEAQT